MVHGKKTILVGVLALLILTSVASAAPHFTIDVFKNSIYTDEAERQGKTVHVYPEICNIGSTGSMKVECGIWTEKQVKSWGYESSELLSFFNYGEPVANCVNTETNVNTRIIQLDTGQCVSPKKLIIGPFGDAYAQFRMTAPNTNPDDEYVICCVAFEQCWSPGVDSGITDYDMVSFDLIDKGLIAESCTDGIWNQDETGTDCGGSECKGCSEYSFCNTKSDCQNGLICKEGRCAKVETDNPECGNGACETGETALTCKEDCAAGNDDDDKPAITPGEIVGIKIGAAIIGLIIGVGLLGQAAKKREEEGIANLIFLILGLGFTGVGLYFLFSTAGNFAGGCIVLGVALVIISNALGDEYEQIKKYLYFAGVLAVLLGLVVGAIAVNKLLKTFNQPETLNLWQRIWR